MRSIFDKKSVLIRRALAYTIDMFLAILLYIGMFLLLIPLTKILSKEQMSALINNIDEIWTLFALIFIYFLIQELFWKKTIGKRMMNLEIVHSEGKRLRVYQLLLRNIFRFIDLVTTVGYLITPFNSKNQRLGGIISRTMVVKRVKNNLSSKEEML